MQGPGMNTNVSINNVRESGDQIPKPPPPVINVDDDHNLNNDTPSPVLAVNVVTDDVIRGRMVWKEKPYNMQEGEPNRRALPHVTHENQSTDHRIDLQAPATTESQPEK
ncbi:hypothetical protein H5410_050939 [Solanum commersonii]|uniref:Uncharacterized protein n=1 Tax=Solanum commersonii TaxID=4109 RepID=A0A9J5WZG3_SOLCO|nr:hypothetical protein H5410_050939 [Solanum commersonii]